MVKHLIHVLSFLLVFGCITPLEIDTGSEIKLLVIEGYITTEYGPHPIHIQRSAKYGSVFDGNPVKINNAFVGIRDVAGNLTPLSFQGNGEYHTPESFRAVVGTTYSLLVEIPGVSTYISTPQTVLPVPQLDSIFFQFESIPKSDFGFTSGIQVFANFQDPETEKNYYMWSMDGTYRILTHPELFTFVDGSGARVPAPKDCCATCYLSEVMEKTDILVDNQFNGNIINRQIGFLADDGGRFMSRYEVEVKMYSLNKDAFAFYHVLNSQLAISGSIFDSPPASIGSNIINTDDPEQQTIGYFGAYDVSSRKAFVDISLIEEYQAVRNIQDDCRVLANTTTTLPAGWPID